MANDYSPQPNSEEFMGQIIGRRKPRKTEEERMKEHEEQTKAYLIEKKIHPSQR